MALEERIRFLQATTRFSSNSDVKKHIEMLFDPDSMFELDALAKNNESYTGVIAVFGKVNGKGVYAFAQDNKQKKGAMSEAQINKICKLYQLAQSTGCPVVGFYDSCGGQLEDEYKLMKALSVMMKETSDTSGVIPQISVICGVCLGTGALIASKADIVITTQGCEFGIDTSGSNSNDNYVKDGMSHLNVKDLPQAIDMVKRLISMLPQNNLDVANLWKTANRGNEDYLEKIGNDLYNSNAKTDFNMFLNCIADIGTAIQLQKQFAPNVSTSLAKFYGETVGIVIMGGGIIDSNSCIKIARFVRFCDAFSLPIITFVNAKKFNSLKDAAKLSSAYCEATTVKINIIIGEAYGTVFSSTCVEGVASDITLAWIGSSVCILDPKTAAILFEGAKLKNSDSPIEDRKKLIEKYKKDSTSPFKSAQRGYIQNVIMPSDTSSQIKGALELLRSKRVIRPAKKHNNIQI